MNQKYKVEDIQRAFANVGYKLLSNSYPGPHYNLDFECTQGHRGKVTWSNFRYKKSRCSECDIQSRRKDIKPFLEKKGYKLISKNYKWYRSKIECICPRGHKIQITWNTFRDGHECPICNREKKVPTFTNIKAYFAKYEYKLLSTEYIKSNTYLSYKCPNEHFGITRWNNFQQGHRCPKCRELKNQKKLGEILEQIFPGMVQSQDNLGFLGRQKVDFSVCKLKLAFEYDGVQHFRPVRFVGMKPNQAEAQFKIQKERDKRKNTLCAVNGIKLIRIGYIEKLTIENIRDRIGIYGNKTICKVR